MRALLVKDWGGYRAGQVLTCAAPGDIPWDRAAWYRDDEIVPVPRVVSNEIDPTLPELAGRFTPPKSAEPPSDSKKK